VNGSGRQDLIGLPEGEDTSGGMDREAANIAGGYLDLAAMDYLHMTTDEPCRENRDRIEPMLPSLGAVALAFGAIFIAEFGDKSQLLILAFRYPLRRPPGGARTCAGGRNRPGHQRGGGRGRRRGRAAAGGRCRCLRPRVPGDRRLDSAR